MVGSRLIAVITLVAVDKTVGHDHVNESVIPHKGSVLTPPKRHEQIVRYVALNINALDAQGVLAVPKPAEVKRPC